MEETNKITLADKRLALYEELRTMFPEGYLYNIYYQPPHNIKMNFPCIEYSFDGVNKTYANDATYLKSYKFTGMVISKNIDDPLFDAFIDHSRFKIVNKTIVDGLHHLYFEINY